ncbi:DinB family protein [Deinococcus taeanensis]|uniref:DinB family protein n=1 Tax=Deinococcus taeanensis TaxID=2737050 RepID=UPI001CDC377A|nr:DinB family protein [Deinococcus taeanensis]UBV42094.1 DinB family protein [Deinococcus taeanensis]
MTPGELQAALNARRDDVAAAFAALSPREFTRAAPGRWSAAQHLDHLTRSNRTLAQGLTLPREQFAARPAGQPGMNHDALRDAYRARLATGQVQASGRYLPDPHGTQHEQLQAYHASMTLLGEALGAFPDEPALDTLTLPHPALGNLSVRELLYFTLYHNEHHLRGVQAALETP